MSDAPRDADGNYPAGVDPDDLVVHQQDVQSVVNAMWAGGAEAMSIMDVRVISTSAVRCVGNTLLLDGQVFSPPFKITAIGEPTAMHNALESAEGVRQFRDAVQLQIPVVHVLGAILVTVTGHGGHKRRLADLRNALVAFLCVITVGAIGIGAVVAFGAARKKHDDAATSTTSTTSGDTKSKFQPTSAVALGNIGVQPGDLGANWGDYGPQDLSIDLANPPSAAL